MIPMVEVSFYILDILLALVVLFNAYCLGEGSYFVYTVSKGSKKYQAEAMAFLSNAAEVSGFTNPTPASVKTVITWAQMTGGVLIGGTFLASLAINHFVGIWLLCTVAALWISMIVQLVTYPKILPIAKKYFGTKE